MAKSVTIRFGAGTPVAPFSGIWRLIISKRDVYLGASKGSMSFGKISLHESGVWTLAATAESGVTFEKANRRAKQWTRPLQHVNGVTRGPSILVPGTSLGARPLPPDEHNTQDVHWYTAPSDREIVEFSIYFVENGIETIWNSGEIVLAEAALHGSRLVLLASKRPSSPDFTATVETMLRENVFATTNPKDFLGGSLLWITQSLDSLKIPIIVDLPVPIRPTGGFPDADG